jgi:hypothetical protein
MRAHPARHPAWIWRRHAWSHHGRFLRHGRGLADADPDSRTRRSLAATRMAHPARPCVFDPRFFIQLQVRRSSVGAPNAPEKNE